MHGRLRPGNASPVAVISLLAAQGGNPEPTQVVKPINCNRDGSTSIRISNHGRKENCSDLRTAATQVDLRHMLEGDVPQELDDKMLF